MSFLSFPNSRKPKQDNETIDPKFHSLFFLSMFSEPNREWRKENATKPHHIQPLGSVTFLFTFWTKRTTKTPKISFRFFSLPPTPPPPCFYQSNRSQPQKRKCQENKKKTRERVSPSFHLSLSITLFFVLDNAFFFSYFLPFSSTFSASSSTFSPSSTSAFFFCCLVIALASIWKMYLRRKTSISSRMNAFLSDKSTP